MSLHYAVKPINVVTSDIPPSMDWASGPTITVKHIIKCGAPSRGLLKCSIDLIQKYEFTEEVPQGFMLREANDLLSIELESEFVLHVVIARSIKLINLRSWKCYNCPKKATEFFHSALARFAEAFDLNGKPVPVMPWVDFSKDSGSFRPTISDTAIPICRAGGKCHDAARKDHEGYPKDAKNASIKAKPELPRFAADHIPMPEGHVRVRMLIKCGDFRQYGSSNNLPSFVFEDELEHTISTHLTVRDGTQKSKGYMNEVQRWLWTWVDSGLGGVLLRSLPWNCQNCGAEANEMMHTPLPFLTGGFGGSSVPTPAVYIFSMPMCRSLGKCQIQVTAMLQEATKKFLNNISPGTAMVTSVKMCHVCMTLGSVKLCKGCRAISYCSKDCQRKDWPNHKNDCHHAQKLRATSSEAKPKDKASYSSQGVRLPFWKAIENRDLSMNALEDFLTDVKAVTRKA